MIIITKGTECSRCTASRVKSDKMEKKLFDYGSILFFWLRTLNKPYVLRVSFTDP